MVKIILARIGSIWCGAIKTFWGIWRIGIIQKPLLILSIFLDQFLDPNCPYASRPKFIKTLRPKCVDYSCKQYIWWKYLNILTQKIMHEDLIQFKIFATFVSFSFMIFEIKMLQYLKIIYSGMNCEEDNYLKKSLLRPHFWEISDQGTDFPKVNLLDIRKFLKQYFKNTLRSDFYYK